MQEKGPNSDHLVFHPYKLCKACSTEPTLCLACGYCATETAWGSCDMPRRYLSPQNLQLRNLRKRIFPFTAQRTCLPAPAFHQPGQGPPTACPRERPHTAHHGPSPYRSWKLSSEITRKLANRSHQRCTLRNKTLHIPDGHNS